MDPVIVNIKHPLMMLFKSDNLGEFRDCFDQSGNILRNFKLNIKEIISLENAMPRVFIYHMRTISNIGLDFIFEHFQKSIFDCLLPWVLERFFNNCWILIRIESLSVERFR